LATFYNQASLSLGGTVTNSNITEGEILDVLTITKTAVSSGYGRGDGISYVVTLTNTGTVPVTGVTVTDNLGAYTVPGTALTVTPLDFVEGSLLYYQSGTLATGAIAEAGPPLTISGITIPASGNVTLIYEAVANEFAPLEAGSGITNSATSSACEEISASDTVTVKEAVQLTISKAVCPATVICGGEVTYTFIIQNTGNIPVVATDNLVVSDTFNPALSNITVTLNGTQLAEGTGYTYNEATGEFSTVASAVTVPAATYTTNPETGVITTTPGVAIITVTGTI